MTNALTVAQLVDTLRTAPETVAFSTVIDTVAAHYDYQPTAFKNGETHNDAGKNEGSCKVFAFAKLNSLTPEQTLHCFGDYYRKDVLEHPEADDHANIRNFIVHGWDGIAFDGEALTAK